MKGITLSIKIDLFDKPKKFTIGADINTISEEGLVNMLVYLTNKLDKKIAKYIDENKLDIYKLYENKPFIKRG
jgi:hypothetical protein